MKNNFLFKLLAGSFALSLIFFGVSIYSFAQLKDVNPNHIKELIEKTTGGRFHIDLNSFDDSYEKRDDKWEFNTEISEIDIRLLNGDIVVETANIEIPDLVVQGHLRKEGGSSLLEVKPENTKIIIEQKGDNSTKSVEATLRIPRNFKGHLKIKSLSGDVHLNLESATPLDIDTLSGDVRIEKSNLGTTSIKTASGEVEIETVVKGPMKVDTLSGSVHIKLQNPESARFSLETLSGDVDSHYTKNSGEYEIRVTSKSGDISVE